MARHEASTGRSSPKASPRMVWAADLIAPRPDDRILEIGPGHGVLIGLIADRLVNGCVIGLDRSAAMIAAAHRTHADAVAAGKILLVEGTVQSLDPPDPPVDVVIAMRVRELWTDPRSLPAVHAALRPGGRLVLIADSPAGSFPAATVRSVTDALTAHGFEELTLTMERVDASQLVAFSATRP